MKWWHFLSKRVEGRCDSIMFCKTLSWLLLNTINQKQKERLWPYFRFGQIVRHSLKLLTVWIFCAAGLNMCVQHPHFFNTKRLCIPTRISLALLRLRFRWSLSSQLPANFFCSPLVAYGLQLKNSESIQGSWTSNWKKFKMVCRVLR